MADEPQKQYDKPLIYNKELGCIEKSTGSIQVPNELKAASINTSEITTGSLTVTDTGIESHTTITAADGALRVGDPGDEKPLLARDETDSLADGAPLVWDGTNLKASTTSTKDGDKVLKSVKDPTTGAITYEWSSIGQSGNGSETYITDETNSDYRMHLTSQGIELEHKTSDTQSDAWETIGRLIVDKLNNLIITNADEDDLPKLRILTPDSGAHIYHLNDDYLDSAGVDSAATQGLAFDGENLVRGDGYPLYEDNCVHEGEAEAECGDRDVLAFTSADWALVGNKWVNLDDGSTKPDTSQQAKTDAEAWNAKGAAECSEWGMSAWIDIFDWRND